MISRHQRIVFWCLIAAIVGMGLWLFYVHQSERDRMHSLADNTPIDAPYTDAEAITLDLAKDDDGSITPTTRQIALPSETTARARALIDHLVAVYAAPDSDHPLPSGVAVNGVFLVPLPVVGHAVDPNAKPDPATGERTQTVLVAPGPDAVQPQTPGGVLAVIDLRGQFVNSHPSGVEVETLTILSILGTLHANIPQIEQVRFLVDGQPRETLAGHADLLRMYPSRDTATAAAAP
jgi:hypothetical protein